MSVIGIIPARFGSTRFPGKPLADINGRSMILRVYDQALLAGLFEDILVATDDQRIADHVQNAGFNSVMTSENHRSGTERCLEALHAWQKRSGKIFDHIINIQGDEPFIHPEQIRKVTSLLTESKAEIATLAKIITKRQDIFNPHVVKVVFSVFHEALYFSRAPVPYLRGVSETNWSREKAHFKHIGIYGFSAEALEKACSLPQSNLETAECLEQLRWLEYGLRIKIGLTTHESISIDTPEDLLKITNIA